MRCVRQREPSFGCAQAENLVAPVGVALVLLRADVIDLRAQLTASVPGPAACGPVWMCLKCLQRLIVKRVVICGRPRPSERMHVTRKRLEHVVPVAKLVEQALHSGVYRS